MRDTAEDARWMAAALDRARLAASAGDVPVGAVVVMHDRAIAHTENRTVRDQDPTAHAEVLALRAAAAALRTWRLEGCTLYVTLEPCAMCAGAIVLARIDRLVIGAWDDKAGMAGSVGDIVRHPRLNHRPQMTGGVRAEESAELLREFFRTKRSEEKAP